MKGAEVNNLNEITFYDDPTDKWAAEFEFKLRKTRYETYLHGGFLGSARRIVEAMEDIRRVLVGVEVK